MTRNKILLAIFSVFFLIAAIYFEKLTIKTNGPIYKISLSSDGRYCVSVSRSKRLILWDIKYKKSKIISNNANIYSAYFIKGTNNYMWQNASNNSVIIENIDGDIVKKFNPGFATYGQVISSDLKNYFASDEKWNVYQIKNGLKKVIKLGLFSPNFYSGKLLNLTLSSNEKYLLSSGLAGFGDGAPISDGQGTAGTKKWSRSLFAGVVLWDAITGKALIKYSGNLMKTYATLSPDYKYVVSGDESTRGFVWSLLTGKKVFELWSIAFGKPTKFGPYGEVLGHDRTGLISVPEKFGGNILELLPPYHYDMKKIMKQNIDGILSLKFIDKTHYLRLTITTPWAILYNVHDPRPIKYFYLKDQPLPSVDAYLRDESIDTAPKAHILVTGQYKDDGIIVYKYDPKKQTLKRIWIGHPPSLWHNLFSSIL